MTISTDSTLYAFGYETERQPVIKNIYEPFGSTHHTDTTCSPPDLLHDSEEDDEDSLCTPSLSLSPKQVYKDHELVFNKSSPCHHGRKKSVPHRSPSVIESPVFDKSIVFQLSSPNQHEADLNCSCKIICGPSLLSSLRQRVTRARSFHHPLERPTRTSHGSRRKRTPSLIEMPRSNQDRTSSDHQRRMPSKDDHLCAVDAWSTDRKPTCSVPAQDQQLIFINQEKSTDENLIKRTKKKSSAPKTHSTHASSGRPARVKGPCQACHEAPDGCMRKAFNWPFPADQIYSDKGKPFVYLCNKCGLRFNKSGGCVCRHCRWVFCKEEKRKALQLIDAMRSRRPDGHIDPDEDIEVFSCNPKYWACGKPWKVSWVLNSKDEDES